MGTCAAAVALLLLLTTTGGYAQLKNYRSRNGVRLQGGTGPKGRVELSSVNSWFNNYSTPDVKPAWNAVCDDAFDDSTALIMCQLLGYSHGRKAYNSRFNFRRSPTVGPPIGRITCQPREVAPSRRLLRATAAEAVDLPSHRTEDGGHRVSRSLYEPLMGTLRTPTGAPYSCRFTSGSCDIKGRVAGIQCSHTPMPSAPPPPPSPPSPPPSPPALSTFIKLVGGRPIDRPDEIPERNLPCAGDESLSCQGYGRVEVQVASPARSGALVWAPVCAIADEELAFSVRYVVCQQILNWPDGRDGTVSITPRENVSFQLPAAPASSPADFNPSKYAGWLTIVGSTDPFKTPRRVQDFNHTVSATPCKSLLAVQCQVFGPAGR